MQKINSIYKEKKNLWSLKPRKIQYIYLDFNDWNVEDFRAVFFSTFRVGVTYSILMKIKYDKNKFGMGGTQIGFKLKSLKDFNTVDRIFNEFSLRLSDFNDKYQTNEILYVQILYITINELKDLKLNNINNLKLNKNFVNIKDTKMKFSSRFLPLTVNEKYFGFIQLGEKSIKYLELINEQKDLLLKNNINEGDFDSMYIYNNKYIILSKAMNENKSVISRDIYNAELGVFECNFIDYITNNNENEFRRSDGKT